MRSSNGPASRNRGSGGVGSRRSRRRRLPRPTKRGLILALGVIALLEAALVVRPQPRGIVVPAVGEVSFRDIRAVRDASLEDVTTTERRRREVEEDILPVYDYDPGLAIEIDQQLVQLFESLRGGIREEETYLRLMEVRLPGAGTPPSEDPGELLPTEGEAEQPWSPVPSIPTPVPARERYQYLVEQTRMPLEEALYIRLRAFAGDERLEQSLRDGLTGVCQAGIVGNKPQLLLEVAQGVVLRNLGSPGEEEILQDVGRTASLEEALDRFQILIGAEFPEGGEARYLAQELAAAVLRPNVSLNLSESERRRQAAREAVKPVYYQVRKGEVLVREGSRITQEVRTRLQTLLPTQRREPLVGAYVGIVLLTALLGGLLGIFLQHYRPRVLEQWDRLMLLALVTLIWTGTTRALIWVAGSIASAIDVYPYNDPQVLLLAVPFAAGAIMTALLMDAATASICAIIFAALSGLLVEGNFAISLMTLIGSLAGVFATHRYQQRTVVLYGGLVVALANIGCILGLALASGGFFPMEITGRVLSGLVGGLLVGAEVMVLLPILEHLFQVPTDIRLLELTNFDRPLLREMALRAPGTHHHSLMVGDLAEAAAEAVGANALLVRVGAYYHDIGKVAKPDYYIENQPDQKRRHQRLTPNMSTLIIVSHVKDGVEMARRHKLGQAITDLIQQHHGTGLIQYFYAKAVKEAGGDPADVDESAFRYPGPRPRSVEAAILMLADCVEAASRSLQNPSPPALKELIERILNGRVMDLQFDECDLTFSQLRLIKEALFQRLMRFHHQRIEYPEDPNRTLEPGQDAVEGAGKPS